MVVCEFTGLFNMFKFTRFKCIKFEILYLKKEKRCQYDMGTLNQHHRTLGGSFHLTMTIYIYIYCIIVNLYFSHFFAILSPFITTGW